MLCGSDDFMPDAPAILVEANALDGCCESFSRRLRDELLSPEILRRLAEARPVAGVRMREN
jgi:hypothetical protein